MGYAKRIPEDILTAEHAEAAEKEIATLMQF
jgi:hypothetical protein